MAAAMQNHSCLSSFANGTIPLRTFVHVTTLYLSITMKHSLQAANRDSLNQGIQVSQSPGAFMTSDQLYRPGLLKPTAIAVQSACVLPCSVLVCGSAVQPARH
jgi:hypothetical protein